VNVRGTSLLISAALSLAVAAFAPGARAAETLIEDFEAAGAIDRWTFQNGAEYPGATGSMSIATGAGGRALMINYDFSSGGAYVAVERVLEQPRSAIALRLGARLPADAVLGVRVRDATGQWLSYPVPRALAPLGGNVWFKSVVALNNADTYWAGANDGKVHPPIDRVAVTLTAAGLEKTGNAQVDKIELLDSLDVTFDPAQVTLTATPPEVKNLMEGLGVSAHSTSDVKALDAAHSAGLTWVRTTLFWDHVEYVKGVYDWSKFDRLLDLLDERGMRALFILAYGNQLYADGQPTSAAASVAFAAYAKAAAKHFANRRVVFEVWNEADNSRFWTPTDPTAYAKFARLTIDAVRAGNPNAQVSTGGLSWFDFDFLHASLAAGAGARAHAIGIHPYRGNAPPESLADDVPRARAVISRTEPSNPPLWDTEWGYNSVQFGAGDSPAARTRQAVMAVRRMVSARLVGFPVAIWYVLRDDGPSPSDGEHNFGLLAYDGAEKPAVNALRTLRRAAEGRTVSGLLNIAQPLVNAVRLEGPNDTLWMVWSAAAGLDARLTVPRPRSVTDMFGLPLTPSTTFVLKEGSGPIYLLYPRAGTPPTRLGSGGAWGGVGGVGGAGGRGGTGSRPPLGADGRPSGNFTSSCGCRVAGEGAAQRPIALGAALLTALIALRRRRN
jgi:MYXO-CTERM domain-containing protein